MKTNVLYVSALLISSMLFSSCFLEDIINCIDPSATIVSDTISVASFDALHLATVGTVNLSQGPTPSVVVSGSDNVVSLIDYEVMGDELTIEIDECIMHSADLIFDITMPSLTSLKISGSGDIEGQTPFIVTDLATKISGSGSIELDLTADHIDSRISGSGDLQFSGTADSLDIRISGSGDIEAFDLTANEANIRISGSGDAKMTVNNSLDVTISGSGTVYYKGSPAVQTNISGSGEVIDAN